MKKQILWILVAACFGFGAGFMTACSGEFDVEAEGMFPCDDDSDCINRYECTGGFCAPFGSGDNGGDHDAGDGEPEECDPESEDYPYDPPLDIQEVCDGHDNNCDGHIDEIFCEYGCPSGQRDPEGNSVTYRCNENTGLCEAFTAFEATPECAGALACTGGALEVRPDCY